MWYLIIGIALTVIELFIIFLLKSEQGVKNLPDKQRIQKFEMIRFLSMLLIFATAALITLLLSKILIATNEYFVTAQKDYLFLIFPDKWLWLVPSLLMGIFSSFFIVGYIVKVLLKEEYEDFVEFEHSNSKYTRNQDKAAKIIVTFVFIVSLVLIYLGFDFNYKFKKEEIVVNPYWQLQEKIYRYVQVKDIKTYTHSENKNGNLENDHYFVVTFSDNTEIRSNQVRELSELELKEIVELISSKSNKKIQKFKVEEF